jgi:predicted O-methyltransferase YrrM
MTQSLWTAVDEYINQLLVPGDPALDEAVRASEAAGLPAIQVSPSQGKFLHILARILGAKKVLEIGTLGGYSTIWMARALPVDGKVITLELSAKHAAVARKNFQHASLEEKIELREGAALESLAKIAGEGIAPFDFIFVDANKSNMPEYFEWALKLSRPGSVIIADNIVRDGKVIDASSQDPDIQGVRRFNEMLAVEKRVSATELQTVGSKGYDGFALALVIATK